MSFLTDEVNFWEMIFRTTLSFAILLILARIMGKKQVSQLTFFHYITGITIGSIAAELASQKETPFTDGLISLVWWTVLTIIMSYISMKSPKIRVWLDDKPTIIIKDGILSENALKKTRLNMDDLQMLLREQSIFSVQDVYYAILETNGQLSVIKKPENQSATKQDVKANISPMKYVPTEIIFNGGIIHKNLEDLYLDEAWLMKKLRKQQVQSPEEVYYAQVQTNGSLFLYLKKDVSQ